MPNRGPGPFRTPGSPQAGGWGGAAAASVPAAAAAGGTTATAGDVYNKAPWLFPPSDYINVDIGPTQGVGAGAATGAVAIPAIGVTATILTYACPNGRYGRITALGIDFVLNGSSAGDAFVHFAGAAHFLDSTRRPPGEELRAVQLLARTSQLAGADHRFPDQGKSGADYSGHQQQPRSLDAIFGGAHSGLSVLEENAFANHRLPELEAGVFGPKGEGKAKCQLNAFRRRQGDFRRQRELPGMGADAENKRVARPLCIQVTLF